MATGDNSSVVTVRPMQPEDMPRWDAFVMAHPAATFFHLSSWQHIMTEVLHHRTHFLLAEQAVLAGRQIVAVLPLVEVNSWLFGHSLSSLPFCVYGGAVGEAQACMRLEAAADQLAQSLGVSYLEYRYAATRHPDWPRQSVYVTFRKTLAADDADNLKAIPRKQRAMIRKGIKNGLIAREDSNSKRFFALYADNVRRHGTPALSRRFFDALQQTFGEQCRILTVETSTGEAVSSVLSFYFRNEVLPYYAGDALSARQLAANDFKYWALMQQASQQGIDVFDYGRSKVGTGPYHFKKNWGFEPQPLAYEYCLYRGEQVPQNNPLNPKYRAAIAVWRHLPLWLTNRVGPHIVRHLG